MSLPLDLVKAPQQIKATLRRLEQVQGPGQNTARLLNKVMKCLQSMYCLYIKCISIFLYIQITTMQVYVFPASLEKSK